MSKIHVQLSNGHSSSSQGDHHSNSSVHGELVKLAACVGCGMVFGIAAEKGKAYDPAVIVGQMMFTQHTMMRLFLGAVISSLSTFTLFSIIPFTQKIFNEGRRAYAGCLTNLSLLKGAIGGAIIGTGMSLSGSCPGMVFVQLGTLTGNSGYTLLGCFSGAVLYSLLHQYMTEHYNMQTSQPFLDRQLNVPYAALAVPFAAVLGTGLLVLDYLSPPAISFMATIPALSQVSWSPLVAGIVMGLVQLPLLLVVGDTMGGSSSYCTIVANGVGATSLSEKSLFRYFNKFRYGIGNWWQVAYVVGGIMGGAISASLSSTLGSTVGVPPLRAFMGGVCLLFGARLASGCTSGHGISGMSLLTKDSFVVTAAMFGGGMVSALFL